MLYVYCKCQRNTLGIYVKHINKPPFTWCRQWDSMGNRCHCMASVTGLCWMYTLYLWWKPQTRCIQRISTSKQSKINVQLQVCCDCSSNKHKRCWSTMSAKGKFTDECCTQWALYIWIAAGRYPNLYRSVAILSLPLPPPPREKKHKNFQPTHQANKFRIWPCFLDCWLRAHCGICLDTC